MKKKLLSLALALALCLGLTVPAFAAEVKIVEVPIPTVEEYEGKVEYYVGELHNGLARLYLYEGGSSSATAMGIVDKTGKVVVPPHKYDGIADFCNGFALVEKDGKRGFVDQTGKEVIPCVYEGSWNFHEGLAAVKKDGKWGCIDKTGKEVIPFDYDMVFDGFSEGMVRAEKNGKWGYIDKTGKAITPFQYDDVWAFSNGLAQVEKDGKRTYIDKTGKTVISPECDVAYTFSDGLALVVKDGKGGFIDKTGKLVIPFQYEYAESFSQGLAQVRQNGKYGFIDKTGKIVIPCEYADVRSFSEGFAAVLPIEGSKNSWSFIDRTGKDVVPPESYTANGVEYDIIGGIDSNDVDWTSRFQDGYARIYLYPSSDEAKGTRSVYFKLTVDAKVTGWAREQVDLAAAKGLMPDSLGDDFTVNITRAQFAAVAVKLYEAMSGEAAPAPGENPFSDTTDPVVLQANALGIVKGSGGKFSPNNLVTRQEAALMLSRVYTKLGGAIPQAADTNFADNSDISPWTGLKDAIAFMADKGILKGSGGRYNPKGNASIQEAMVIALRMIENLDVQ